MLLTVPAEEVSSPQLTSALYSPASTAPVGLPGSVKAASSTGPLSCASAALAVCPPVTPVSGASSTVAVAVAVWSGVLS